MALQMQFQDQYGNNLAESYWRLVQTVISVPDKSASLIFYGYVNAQARTDLKQPVASKQYSIMGEQFDVWYDAVLNSENTNLAKSAYDLAKSTKDAKVGEELVSFFETATNI